MLISKKYTYNVLKGMLLIVSVAFFSMDTNAQIDSLNNTQQIISDSTKANTTEIQVVHADDLKAIKTQDDHYINKLIGNVRVQSGDITMTCDSAFLDQISNRIKAYGNVKILRGSNTSAKANYVEYIGNTAQAFMKENVQVYDNGSNLITDDLSYNLRSKIGIYKNGGQLVSDGTTISSDYGKYNGRSKQSYFKGNVFITNPDSDIESKELTYNTNSKKIVFLDESTVYGNDAMIETSGGTYNQKSGKANFTSRTTINNDDQIITANRLIYNQKTGSGKASGKVVIFDKNENTTLYANVANYNKKSGGGSAKGRVTIINETDNTILYANSTRYNKEKGTGSAKGNVIIIDQNENTVLYADATDYNKNTGYVKAKGKVKYVDTTENIELTAGQVEFNELNDFLLATENPILTTITDNDTILIISDTMISLRQIDTSNLQKRFIRKGKSTYTLLHQGQPETLEDKKLIICDNRVQIYGDSMQAVCDSMIYKQSDSLFNLFKKPVVWSNNQQAEGDTINIFMANGNVRKTELRNNSYIVDDTGYPKMYNQIKGKNIDALFDKNEIQNALVMGNAESIYYASNEAKEFIGLNRAEGARIKILFKEKEIQRIVFYNKPKGTFYPMDKIKAKDKFLTGFKWKSELRPKSREALRKRQNEQLRTK